MAPRLKKNPHPPCEGWGLLSFPVCSRLEDKLQGELHDARRNRTASDRPESGQGAKVVSRRIELSVVPDVIKLRPELRVQRFRNLRVLDKGHVPVVLSGSHDNTDTRVSESRSCPREQRSFAEKRRSGRKEWARESAAGCRGIAARVRCAANAGCAGKGAMVDPSIAACEAAQHTLKVAAGCVHARSVANAINVALSRVRRGQLGADIAACAECGASYTPVDLASIAVDNR